MKKLFLFSALVLFALSANAQFYPMKGYMWNPEAMQASYGENLDNLFFTKFSAASTNIEAGYSYASSDSDIEKFLSQYDAKIMAAKLDKAYQAKISALKKKPLPHRHLSSDYRNECRDFMNIFVKLRTKFFARVKKYNLPNPSKSYPERYNSILSDEKFSNHILSSYYRHINSCIYGMLDRNACSKIVTPYTENLVNIASAAIDMEDMPVFYGALDAIYDTFKNDLEPTTLTYVFHNSEKIELYK